MINKDKRLIIIGLDGVPFTAVKKLSEEGVMNNVSALIKEGSLREMNSSVPEVSSVAWSSMITGGNPGRHGIYGFTELRPDSYQLSFPNFEDLKSLPFWLDKKEGISVIINVPSTYPVRRLNGAHISGFVSIDFERSIYPVSLIPKLRELDYRIDVDSSLAHKSLDLFLEDLDETLKARIRAYRYLWQDYDWQTFMLVFTGTDRLAHFLWDAYEDENHKYHTAFLEHFKKIDKVIGEIRDNLRQTDLLVLLSDHGFELLDENFNVNYFLKARGLLKFKKGSRQNLPDIDTAAGAFALDPGRIYLNLTGKYPCGSVSLADSRRIVRDLKQMFVSLERNGKKVIKEAFEKEEIYEGPCIDTAPDLILVPEKGFNLKANVTAEQLYEKNIFKGKHTRHDAFFLVNRKDTSIIPAQFSVYDVLEVINFYLAA